MQLLQGEYGSSYPPTHMSDETTCICSAYAHELLQWRSLEHGIAGRTCLRARSRKSVDLPMPFGPARPYRRPAAMVTLVFSSSTLPFTRTVRLCTCDQHGDLKN